VTALWWVRRDIRLADNPALIEAQAAGTAAAVFAWTPAIDRWPGRRQAYLAKTLWSLRESTGGALGVRLGTEVDVVRAAAAECGAETVWAAQEYSPVGMRTQEAVREALAADGRELKLIGSPYAVAPGRVTKADGSEYKVFTPFSRAWRAHGWRAPAVGADGLSLQPLASDVNLDQQAAYGDTRDPLGFPPRFGEEAALRALEEFIGEDGENSPLNRYAETRDLPAMDATSRLSIALAHGEIHPRTVLSHTSRHSSTHARIFESQIAWRDFHADVLWRHPRAQRESLTDVLPEDAWSDSSEEAFTAWKSGHTGFPLVDAGMRELQATGVMHNRVRMVVASFLVKDLRVPWQVGADFFREKLLDYDHAQNQLNWQWVAGTGRDAAPFFRIFNPTRQAEKFDPDRSYIERWVPEIDTPGYAQPIVDHAMEREITLAAYKRRSGT